MKIAFDIGGVLSKYPKIFLPLIEALWTADVTECVTEACEVHIITDMQPHERAVQHCRVNGVNISEDRIHCADYQTHGEMCKAILCKELGIDLLVDDFPGYVACGDHVRLLVMPHPTLPYYHDEWKTDGSEGSFGRRPRPTKGDHCWP